MIEPDHEELSVREQCRLLGLSRSTLYYRPQPMDTEADTLMRRIDELHTAHIALGSRKIRDALRPEGWRVNRKRVQRLMRLMALRVVFPQQHHQRLPPDHEVYPYLLRGLSFERPNQFWSIDLIYIRLGDTGHRRSSTPTTLVVRFAHCSQQRRTAGTRNAATRLQPETSSSLHRRFSTR